jgi:superfamily II DNA helicase RecQ
MAEQHCTSAALDRAIDLAVKTLGYSKLREKQREAIVAFVNGHDCFVSLPTGYGKYICYAVLPYLFDMPTSASFPL